jgi:HD-GYP domain-containing protein (c-di-GMP phosphodiesterase class II)
MRERRRELVTALAVAVSRAQLYAQDHAARRADAAKILEALAQFEHEQVEIMVIAGELVIDSVLFRDAGLHGEKLVKVLRAKGISRIDLLAGLGVEELQAFVSDLADADRELASYARVRAGTMGVRAAAGGLRANLDLTDYNAEQLARLQSLYGAISPFRELETAGLEEIVANFLLTFRRGANVLQMLGPVKSHSEYTHTHALNVAVLSMAQADHLGLGDEIVEAVGVAALMHDVGKLFVSREVLHKNGALTADEFTEIKRHPLLGAAYLARVDGITRLAPVVALEHHRKFDASGYPPMSGNWRRQHTASQIVAIADFFDALRSNRPYRASLSVQEVLQMMQKGSGKDFNPTLLGSFVMLLVNAL